MLIFLTILSRFYEQSRTRLFLGVSLTLKIRYLYHGDNYHLGVVQGSLAKFQESIVIVQVLEYEISRIKKEILIFLEDSDKTRQYLQFIIKLRIGIELELFNQMRFKTSLPKDFITVAMYTTTCSYDIYP